MRATCHSAYKLFACDVSAKTLLGASISILMELRRCVWLADAAACGPDRRRVAEAADWVQGCVCGPAKAVAMRPGAGGHSGLEMG